MFRSVRALKRRFLGVNVPEIPVKVRHAEYSVVMSADDDNAGPTNELINLALAAASRACCTRMTAIVNRMKSPPYYPNIWPGEHYKFLSGLVEELKPNGVIEIGTSTGMSALAIMSALPETGRLHTFDIVHWNKFPDTCLLPEDFLDGKLVQVVGNVGNIEEMKKHIDLFRNAELIFVDGPKDGIFESRLLEILEKIGLQKNPILVFDDIRLWNMLAIWRNIRKPKLDVTSFGHWSGTGLVQWQ